MCFSTTNSPLPSTVGPRLRFVTPTAAPDDAEGPDWVALYQALERAESELLTAMAAVIQASAVDPGEPACRPIPGRSAPGNAPNFAHLRLTSGENQ